MSNEQRLKDLGIELPPAPKPVGVYKPMVIVNGIAYLSGHGPLNSNKQLTTGVVGRDLDVDAGYDAAKLTGMGLLSTLQSQLGSLDKVQRVVKLLGLVQCVDGFPDSPAVINGCSELFRDVFGPDAGVGARSAIGTNSLPGGISVEIEAIFEVDA